MNTTLPLSIILPIKSSKARNFDEYFEKAIASINSQTVGIEELMGLNNITIYPNPANESLFVAFENQSGSAFKLLVSDRVGRIRLANSSSNPCQCISDFNRCGIDCTHVGKSCNGIVSWG